MVVKVKPSRQRPRPRSNRDSKLRRLDDDLKSADRSSDVYASSVSVKEAKFGALRHRASIKTNGGIVIVCKGVLPSKERREVGMNCKAL
jgi:hypothetical protein